MSCGKLHEQGEPFHLHAPGEEHHDDHPEADDTISAELDVPEPKAPGWVERTFAQVGTAASGAWRQNGYLVKPFAVIPAMEGSEFLISHAFTDPVHALAAAGVLTLAGEGVTEAVNWRGNAVRPVRGKTRFAVAAGGVMAVIGGAGVFDTWTVLATLVVGAVTGGRIVHEEVKAHKNRPSPVREAGGAPEPKAVTAGPDPRLVQFTGALCGPGCPLAGTKVLFREVTNGFLFELDFTGTQHAPDDVAKVVTQVAKLFNVRKDEISVEYVPVPARHSENYCQVVIRKVPLDGSGERVKPAVRHWDGVSTWDPVEGTIDLGWYTDGSVTPYQLHKPRSGAMHGIVAGVTGSGKTGTVNVIACEAGMAKLCRACGGRRSCPSCSLERVMAVWTGDAQGNGLAQWHGRADLSAVGPEGCIEMLEFAGEVARDRAERRLDMPWSDRDPETGDVRQNKGKGFHDVEIGDPLILFVLDEYPKMVGPDADPLIRRVTLQVIISALTTWRKLGMALLLASGSGDTALIGDRIIRDILRELNVVAHRLGEQDADMIGIDGADPRKLPRDLPGAGLTGGIIGRRGAEFATKFIGEIHQPGEKTDVRSIAGKISRTRLLYDAPVQRLMGQWDIPHQHVFTHWYGREKAEAASMMFPAEASPRAPAPAVPLAAVPEPGEPAAQDTEMVLAFLRDNPGPHSLGAVTNGVFRATGTKMSVAAVMAVAPALHASQQAVYGADKKLQAA